MNIDLTIPANVDYDLRLYRLDNSSRTSCGDLDFNNPDHIFEESKSGNRGEGEHISLAYALPGTYCIVVYSYMDNYCDNDHEYSLSIEAVTDTTTTHQKYYIDDGRKAGDLCAIWKSDFDPLGIKPLSKMYSKGKMEVTNYDSYPMIRHLFDTYANGKSNTYAVLFVWDLEIRKYLHSYFEAMLQSLDSKFFDQYGNEINFDENKEQHFSIAWNHIGLAVAIGGIVGLFIKPVGWIATMASPAMAIYSFLKTFETNEIVMTKRQFRDYLMHACTALEVGRGTSNEEVVMLKSQYRFYQQNGKRYIDWSPALFRYENSLYNDFMIYTFLEGAAINGTIDICHNKQQIETFFDFC